MAHLLAKMSLHTNDEHYWMEDGHESINCLISKDKLYGVMSSD